MHGEVNVIISDGFTGNVALKTAEGTANFITSELKEALSGSILGKISSLLNLDLFKTSLMTIDPSSSDLIFLNEPLKVPIGVLIAPTITTSINLFFI